MKALMTVLVTALFGGVVLAGPFPSNVANDLYNGNAVNGTPTPNMLNDGAPDLFQAYNAVAGAALTRNEQLDPKFVEPDAVWDLINDSGSIILIGMTAGNANTVGYYTDIGVGASKTALLGPYQNLFQLMGPPYPAALFNVSGSFGFYLDSQAGSTMYNWFSESALNPGGWDHMITYAVPELAGEWIPVSISGQETEIQLHNPYLIGWEDLPYAGRTLGDDDYDDMIYLVDAVPTPEPGEWALLLTCALGTWGYLRRFRK